MIYDRKVLQAKVLEIKTAHEKALKAQRASEVRDWERSHKNWEAKHKDEIVAALADALKKAKAGTLYDTHFLSRFRAAPSPPKHGNEISCEPIIMSLTALSEMLDTVADDTISASALARAGVSDLTRLLRRPC